MRGMGQRVLPDAALGAASALRRVCVGAGPAAAGFQAMEVNSYLADSACRQ